MTSSVRALRRTLRPSTATSGRLVAAAWFAGTLAIAAFAGENAASPTFSRLIVAAAFLALVVAFGMRNPRGLLLALPVWLVALGLVRRLLSGISTGGSADPMLLVEPVALIILVFAAADRGAFKGRSTLSSLVLAYTGLTLLGAFNPEQGSMKAGVTSLIFFVPMLAFWVGRGLVDDGTLRKLLLVIGVAAIPAALYGLNQTFGSFPSWDQRWIAAQGYSSLNVGGAVRPFGTFSSSAEYATFLALAMLIWLRLGPRRFLRPIGVATAALLVVAVFYQGSRGSVVVLLAAFAVMLAARRRMPLTAAAVIGAALLAAMPYVVKQIAPTSNADATGSSALVQHQVQGLANPLDPNSSTAGAHFHQIWLAMGEALRKPAGQGIGAVTIAGAKFGAIQASAEADPGNAAVALGLPGLVLFFALFFVAYRSTYSLARGGGALAGVAMGILVGTTLQWLNGGEYSVAFLPWLVLGWVDRQLLLRKAEPTAEAAAPAPLPETPRPPTLRRLPRPRPRPQPAPAAETAAKPAETAPRRPRGPMPRRWNVFELEALPELSLEQHYLLVELRRHASPEGLLPLSFDGFVRSSFGVGGGAS
ncbi:MAG TPA: hypothetical protein VFJ91_10730 [Gaiellaceae bacterium]|nr:hypothetical protein [Gaiellaceae bacterium]